MKKKKLIIHHFLLPIFPVLFLFAKNISLFPISVLIWPLLIIFLSAFFFSSFFSLLFKNRERATLLTSFLFFAFLSYGYFQELLSPLIPDFTNAAKQNLLIFIIWYFLIVFISLLLIRKIKIPVILTRYLNLVAVFLVLTSLANISLYYLGVGHSPKIKKPENFSEKKEVVPPDSTPLPNIYYIILDGYGRSDILQEMYAYNNSELTNFLLAQGFFIASKASANYIQTALSLASSFNLNYVQNLLEKPDSLSNNRQPLNDLIKNSRVLLVLEKRGYAFKGISSGYHGTEIRKFSINPASGNFLGEFENAVLARSPLSIILNLLVNTSPSSFAEMHRKRILNSLERLGQPLSENPQFVFAHIMSPHPPFVFDEKGHLVENRGVLSGFDGSHFIGQDGLTKENYQKYYREQITFISKEIKKVIESIFAHSQRPPVIILQSDHGPGSELDWESLARTNLKERFSILNAYYLPDHQEDLYDSVSPVNSFRVIFNQYFNSNYPLLEDKNYFSTWSQPYQLINVSHNL